MRLSLLVTTLIAVLSPGCATRQLSEIESAPVGRLKPDRGVVLPIEAASALFVQCSRPSPRTNGHYWTPTADEISQFEARFLEFYKGKFRARSLDSYSRQYVGFYSPDGQRFIYANFFRTEIRPNQDPDIWKNFPVIVCDGGSNYFGIVYDPALDSVIDYEINGF